MKTNNFSMLAGAALLALALACSKEDLTEEEYITADADFTKSVTADSSMTSMPDIFIDDPVLAGHASVSQNREDFIAYTYDRYNRLFTINYFRRNDGLVSSATDAASMTLYMQDRFIYSNTGRLVELLRYVRSIAEPQMTVVSVAKSYSYNKDGTLGLITTKWPGNPEMSEKYEYLEYDNMQHMIKRTVKQTSQSVIYYKYIYDRSGRLIQMAGFIEKGPVPLFYCDIFYDNRNNIERKDFYYPSPAASVVNNMYRAWVVKYKYDSYFNPFKDFGIPVSSLFEWMDLISPANITAIHFGNDPAGNSVFYSYKYNNLGYPVLRMRILPELTPYFSE
jgi:hypothetical protein